MHKTITLTTKAALATMLIAGWGATAVAKDDVKLGILMGFTGPIESLTPDMAAGAEFAIAEVNKSEGFFGGKVSSVRADSTCVDAAAASTAAERLITSDGISGLVGADCSGVTIAVLTNVARANGMVMISPSATSPALTTTPDDDLFFRTSPSDARQGVIMADVILEKGHKTVALTYTKNDYGKGLADAFETAYKAKGGEVTISVPHEDGKADYAPEVGSLSSAGGNVLVVVGYLDQGGKGIIQASLDSGAFDTFVLPDAMVGDSLAEHFGKDIEGSFGQLPGSDSPGGTKLKEMATGFAGDGPFVGSSYDAAAIILLAMQSAKSSNPSDYKSHVLKVSNAPGTKIFPGELDKALKLLAKGKKIDFVGASDVELIGPGESAGSYREIIIKKGKFKTVGYRK